MKGDGVSPLVKCLQQRNNSSICLAWIFLVSCGGLEGLFKFW